MSKFLNVALVTVLGLCLGACKKDGEGTASAKGGEPAELSLPVLGLKATAPPGSKAEKGILGDGQLIKGPSTVVSVEVASDMRAKTIAEAKENAATFHSAKDIKAEKLADGFVVTYTNKGSMGTNYFVAARRSIGGKDYWCDTTGSQQAQSDNAVSVCKSLKK